jgi:hypothetical protein
MFHRTASGFVEAPRFVRFGSMTKDKRVRGRGSRPFSAEVR